MTVEPAVATTPSLPPSFDAMNLTEPLRRALAEVGYSSPTEVQTSTFGPIAAGRDVIVQSKTGSGKTAAFAIPLLDRVVQPEKRVQAMVLCPTRELALQVGGEFARLGKYRGVSTTAIYGGASMSKQIDEIKAGAQVVSGTPGRVLDHLRRGTLDVSGLRAIVLDEADEMLSMGFAEELNAILEFIPKKRQGLLFSATMPEQIRRMAKRHLTEPQFITLSTDNIAPSEVTHYAYFVGAGSRTRELARILEVERPDGTIVFCNTKNETETVAAELQRLGLDAEFLNGDLEQANRERIMAAFRAGTIRYLVATDVAARGIDVTNVSHVVNYGFPESAEQYVHRTGRTGRAGRKGTAISIITPRDVGSLYFLRLTYGIRPIERALPSATEEKTRRELDRIQLLREAFIGEPSDEALSLARRLLSHDEADTIIAGLVSEFFHIAAKQAIARGIGPNAAGPATPASQASGPTPSEGGRTGRESQRAPARGSLGRVDAPPAPRERAPEIASAPPLSTSSAAPAEGRARIDDRRGPPVRGPRPPAERARRVDVHNAPGEASFDDDGPEIGMEEMRLAVGRRDGVRAGDIARMVREKANVQRRDVGRIYVRDRFSLVSVRAELLDATIEALKDAQLADRPLAPEKGKPMNPTVHPPAAGSDGDVPSAVVAAPRVPSLGEPEE